MNVTFSLQFATTHTVTQCAFVKTLTISPFQCVQVQRITENLTICKQWFWQFPKEGLQQAADYIEVPPFLKEK